MSIELLDDLGLPFPPWMLTKAEAENFCPRCEGDGAYSTLAECTTRDNDCACNGPRLTVDPCATCDGSGEWPIASKPADEETRRRGDQAVNTDSSERNDDVWEAYQRQTNKATAGFPKPPTTQGFLIPPRAPVSDVSGVSPPTPPEPHVGRLREHLFAALVALDDEADTDFIEALNTARAEIENAVDVLDAAPVIAAVGPWETEVEGRLIVDPPVDA